MTFKKLSAHMLSTTAILLLSTTYLPSPASGADTQTIETIIEEALEFKSDAELLALLKKHVHNFKRSEFAALFRSQEYEALSLNRKSDILAKMQAFSNSHAAAKKALKVPLSNAYTKLLSQGSVRGTPAVAPAPTSGGTRGGEGPSAPDFTPEESPVSPIPSDDPLSRQNSEAVEADDATPPASRTVSRQNSVAEEADDAPLPPRPIASDPAAPVLPAATAPSGEDMPIVDEGLQELNRLATTYELASKYNLPDPITPTNEQSRGNPTADTPAPKKQAEPTADAPLPSSPTTSVTRGEDQLSAPSFVPEQPASSPILSVDPVSRQASVEVADASLPASPVATGPATPVLTDAPLPSSNPKGKWLAALEKVKAQKRGAKRLEAQESVAGVQPQPAAPIESATTALTVALPPFPLTSTREDFLATFANKKAAELEADRLATQLVEARKIKDKNPTEAARMEADIDRQLVQLQQQYPGMSIERQPQPAAPIEPAPTAVATVPAPITTVAVYAPPAAAPANTVMPTPVAPASAPNVAPSTDEQRVADLGALPFADLGDRTQAATDAENMQRVADFEALPFADPDAQPQPPATMAETYGIDTKKLAVAPRTDAQPAAPLPAATIVADAEPEAPSAPVPLADGQPAAPLSADTNVAADSTVLPAPIAPAVNASSANQATRLDATPAKATVDEKSPDDDHHDAAAKLANPNVRHDVTADQYLEAFKAKMKKDWKEVKDDKILWTAQYVTGDYSEETYRKLIGLGKSTGSFFDIPLGEDTNNTVNFKDLPVSVQQQVLAKVENAVATTGANTGNKKVAERLKMVKGYIIKNEDEHFKALAHVKHPIVVPAPYESTLADTQAAIALPEPDAGELKKATDELFTLGKSKFDAKDSEAGKIAFAIAPKKAAGWQWNGVEVDLDPLVADNSKYNDYYKIRAIAIAQLSTKDPVEAQLQLNRLQAEFEQQKAKLLKASAKHTLVWMASDYVPPVEAAEYLAGAEGKVNAALALHAKNPVDSVAHQKLTKARTAALGHVSTHYNTVTTHFGELQTTIGTLKTHLKDGIQADKDHPAHEALKKLGQAAGKFNNAHMHFSHDEAIELKGRHLASMRQAVSDLQAHLHPESHAALEAHVNNLAAAHADHVAAVTHVTEVHGGTVAHDPRTNTFTHEATGHPPVVHTPVVHAPTA